MNVTFYQFSKRSNSTKIVDVSGTTLSCELKSAVSMQAPTLLIQAVPASWNPIWNYCYIPGFSRYYFVNDWTWVNGVWECNLVIDVLASFKTDIGNMSEYIARSSYEFDPYVVDTYYATTADVRFHKTLLTTNYLAAWDSGFYIIGIISKESNATQGAIAYYQMTASEFARLRAYLLSDTFLQDQGLVNLADFVPADATKVIYNPFQYVVSCKWYPFAPSAIPSSYKTAVTSIYFGWWNTGTGFTANLLKSTCPTYAFSYDYSFVNHPQMTRGVWLNRSPYTQRVVRYAPFGDVIITDDMLKETSKLRTNVTVDFITGVAILELCIVTEVEGASTVTIISREAQDISVDIQLAQVGRDYFGAQSTRVKNATNVFNKILGSDVDLSSIGSAAKSGFQLGINIGQASDYQTYTAQGNYLKANAPQLLTTGSNGSMAWYTTQAYLYEFYYIIEEDDNAHIGRPLCDVRTISNIPGFIMVTHADVNISCFETERSLIKQFLTGGFYYE